MGKDCLQNVYCKVQLWNLFYLINILSEDCLDHISLDQLRVSFNVSTLFSPYSGVTSIALKN